MSLRAAVIGLGKKGFRGWALDNLYEQELTHVGAILKTSGLELKAVCDSDQETIIQFVNWNIEREKFPEKRVMVEAFGDYQDMINKVKPDVVSIATPVETHAKIARNVMRFDCVKSLLVEKPIADNVNDAKAIVEDSKSFKVPVIINHTRRWQAIWKAAKRKIRAFGGAIQLVGVCNGEPLDAGVHMADLFTFLDSKAMHTYVDAYEKNMGKYRPFLLFELDAFCRNGVVQVSHNGRTLGSAIPEVTKRYRDLVEYEWVRWKDFEDDMGEATLAAFAELRDLALGKRKRPTCSAEDGFKALSICQEWLV